jgi:hypothetical protein
MPDEPIRTTTFMLGRADALAYEQAASRLTPLGVIALICWLGLCGAAALLIPADWGGARLSLTSSLLISIAVALGYVVALLLISVRQYWRARRRYRRPLEVTVTEWPDRLDLVGTGTLDAIPFTGIRRTVLTRTHLFLDTDADPVILPRRAFAEEGAVEDLAHRIEGIPKPLPPEPGPPPSVDPAPPSA